MIMIISCPYTLTKDVLPANGIVTKSTLLNLTLFSYIRTNLSEPLKDKLRLKLYKTIYFFLNSKSFPEFKSYKSSAFCTNSTIANNVKK